MTDSDFLFNPKQLASLVARQTHADTKRKPPVVVSISQLYATIKQETDPLKLFQQIQQQEQQLVTRFFHPLYFDCKWFYIPLQRVTDLHQKDNWCIVHLLERCTTSSERVSCLEGLDIDHAVGAAGVLGLLDSEEFIPLNDKDLTNLELLTWLSGPRRLDIETKEKDEEDDDEEEEREKEEEEEQEEQELLKFDTVAMDKVQFQLSQALAVQALRLANNGGSFKLVCSAMRRSLLLMKILFHRQVRKETTQGSFLNSSHLGDSETKAYFEHLLVALARVYVRVRLVMLWTLVSPDWPFHSQKSSLLTKPDTVDASVALEQLIETRRSNLLRMGDIFATTQTE